MSNICYYISNVDNSVVITYDTTVGRVRTYRISSTIIDCDKSERHPLYQNIRLLTYKSLNNAQRTLNFLIDKYPNDGFLLKKVNKTEL